jgi:iron(II)-dependent oxidoreductase
MVSPTRSASSANSALHVRLVESRRQTDDLFSSVRREALFDRPIPERHRLIFYLGHLEAFDWNLIARESLGVEPFHPEFDKLFAFGIDPTGDGLPTDQPHDWPSEDEVRRYDARVRSTLDGLIDRVDPTLLHVAIEHRLMHAETLTYLLHQLPLDRKIPGTSIVQSALPVEERLIAIPTGTVTLGQNRGAGRFGWDNEFEAVRVDVPEFRVAAFPITNAQFLEFVRAGGYEQSSLWSPEDWAWKSAARVTHPCFWRRGTANDGDDWRLRTMFAEVPLPADRPVYVSHAEASAYARWAGKKLPTEAQWQRVAYGTTHGDERSYPWGDADPGPEYGNFDFARWDPTSVHAHPKGTSAFGVADLLGNGWEWTSTPFAPLPGFEAFPFYLGYSANFFDGKHFVMKGGSPRTAACMLRRSFRNWFQPHYPYVYAKFRCVEE